MEPNKEEQDGKKERLEWRSRTRDGSGRSEKGGWRSLSRDSVICGGRGGSEDKEEKIIGPYVL